MKAAHAIALLLSFAGCVTDLRSRRIPNVLTLVGALAALIFHGVTDGGAGLLAACLGWTVGFAFFFPPFALGGMGGGDLKLLAALGAWVGPEAMVWLTLYTGLAGGIMALVVAIACGYLRQALSNVWLLLTHWSVVGIGRVDEVSLAGSQTPRLAYAVPILVGTTVTIWLNP